ncbi:WD repeat-containing protein 74 [Desmophyllum pertusum]|uniref:WD repeat-containing protein 74 n=1 Tax=Desmophyllum pertusum TaxID=174260 RepID=A0A9W9ZXP2_9CNID|nr:WD repeat-containing protein 74 [Desmophyllum pertusum]
MVPNDFLDLQVPIWVTELGFLPGQGSLSRIAVGTGYHQVRLYDTKTQRRPVLSFHFGESLVSALALTDNEK